MTKNQRQRKAGATVLKSKQEAREDKIRRLEKQLAKASDLESQLTSLLKQTKGGIPSDNETAQTSYKLRSHLCEILSDVLISDPAISLQKDRVHQMDCFQRLWRACFYNPITIWRHRVSREKRKRSPNLPSTQEGFKNFLSEAVTLYDYLVLQYLTKLVPSATQQSQGSSMYDRSQLEDTQFASQSTNITLDAEKNSSMEGVVPGLYKLYIFLGDLHRYAEAYTKAEACYWNASKLGPGLGNAYNQLAVIAFSRDTYCVALYWHVRSLMVTHGRFSTSSVNMERLFVMNRQFLQEHGRNAVPMVLETSQGDSTRHGNKGSMLKAQKTAASKSCLTHFVDLHYDLYSLLQEGGDPSSTEKSNVQVREKIQNVVASLKSLVSASGFSDSLLCKMVVINSFCMERVSDKSDLVNDLVLSMGLVLVEHTEGLLKKSLKSTSGNNNKKVPSIRCLLPLELLLEFVALDRSFENERKETTTIGDVEMEFWKRTVVVANLVRTLAQNYKLADQTPELFQWKQIHEYKLLKGYRPFPVANAEYSLNENGYLETAEAVDALELSSTALSQLSQDTGALSTMTGNSTASNSGSGGGRESKARILRMMEVCDLLSSAQNRAPMRKGKDGEYVYESPESKFAPLLLGAVQRDGDQEMAHDAVEDSLDSDDEAGDIIVYEEAKEMPVEETKIEISPHGQNMVVEETNSEDVAMTESLPEAEEKEESLSSAPPAVVKPPPGFGGPATLNATSVLGSVTYSTAPLVAHHLDPVSQAFPTRQERMVSGTNSDNYSGLGPGLQDGTELDLVSPLFQEQKQASVPPIPGLVEGSFTHQEPLFAVQSRGPSLINSVEESIRVFGDMRTANPYALTPPYGVPLSQANTGTSLNGQPALAINAPVSAQTAPAVMLPGFLTEPHGTTSDDTSKWLNSNLLTSLWMEEGSASTNNPWAGK